jgi:hypothetical protein
MFIFSIAFGNASESAILQDVKSYKVSLHSDSNITVDDKLFKKSSNSFKLNANSSILIKLELFNSLSKSIDRDVIFTSAIIDKLKVFKKEQDKLVLFKDLSYGAREDSRLKPSISINLDSKERKKIYILASNKYLPVQFKIKVQESNKALTDNSSKTLLYTFILGLLVAIVAIFAFLYLYTNEVSYIYFSLLLFIAILIHIYISGLEIVYFSKNFLMLDRALTLIKFNLLFIVASIHAIYFYKIDKEHYIFKVHMYFIYSAVAYVVISGFLDISYLLVPMFVAYILVNIATAIYYSLQGKIEAIFYLAAYALIALSAINKFYYANKQELLGNYHFIIFLVIYTLMALSYVVRYIDTKRKEANMVASALDKKQMIEGEIDSVKVELDKLEQSEERLKDRMNTIIKNNLHLVLSMLKMKNSTNLEVTKEIEKLDIRVSVMVRIYSIFLAAKDIKSIDMKEYMPIILSYLDDKYQHYPKRVKVVSNIDAIVTQNEAIDIAITIADIIISSYEDGTYIDDKLLVTLKVINGSYNLSIKDIGASKSILGGKIKGILGR